METTFRESNSTIQSNAMDVDTEVAWDREGFERIYREFATQHGVPMPKKLVNRGEVLGKSDRGGGRNQGGGHGQGGVPELARIKI